MTNPALLDAGPGGFAVIQQRSVEGDVVEVAHTEMVEKEIDRMIEKRAREEPDLDEREELWKASVRAYNAAREAERRAAWSDYHQGQAKRLRRVMTNLVEPHERQAIKLSETKEGTA